MAALGTPFPTPEARLQLWLALIPAAEWPIDGAYPLGTDHCVLVGKDAPARLLLTPEATSEHGADAKTLRQHVQDRGRHVTAAFSADSPSGPTALKAV
jgi:hypothetical protein